MRNIEYCSRLWDGSAKYQLATLDSVERRAKKLIDDAKPVEKNLHTRVCRLEPTAARSPACRSSTECTSVSVLKSSMSSFHLPPFTIGRLDGPQGIISFWLIFQIFAPSALLHLL